MEQMEISRATMGRLPGYLQYLRALPPEQRYVSSTAVARALELGEVQVRKDLSAVCGTGRPKVGYDLAVLIRSLEAALGAHRACEAVIVGAGKLGLALLGFSGFSEYGITLSRAFDVRVPEGDGRVLPLSELPAYCATHQVEIGILTVPPEAAQEAAELLIHHGIRAIWCFATVRLQVPEGVTVQYENMALSLAHLHRRVVGGTGTSL